MAPICKCPSGIYDVLSSDGPPCRTSYGGIAIDDPLALPPGFRALSGGPNPWDAALKAVALDADPGSVFWDGAHGRCRAAFVFAPDRPLGGGRLVLDLGVLALFDALAVLAPPQTPLHIVRPDGLAVDGGRVASLRVAVAPSLPDAVPDWVVLGLDVAVEGGAASPGDTPGQTCLHEEGFGDVAPADVLMHTCRHLLGWLDVWRQDGAAALAQVVAQRTARAAVAA